MQSNLNIGPAFHGRVRQMIINKTCKEGFSLEGCIGLAKTKERDDLVLAGIISVLKDSNQAKDFTLNSQKAKIVFNKLVDMTDNGYFRLTMPDTSKGIKFFRGNDHFTMIPVDAKPNQLAIVYEFPENAAIFYNA